MNSIQEILETKLSEVLSRSPSNLSGLQIEVSADQIDRATNESDRHFAAANSDRDLELVKSLRNALERVKDGTYGVCERCEGEIDSRRIAALPWAVTCVPCQEFYERTGKRDQNSQKVTKLQNRRPEHNGRFGGTNFGDGARSV